MSTVPAEAAGDSAVIEVGLFTLKLVAGVAPNDTEMAPVRSVPVMVAEVAPPVGPDEGATPVTVGTRTGGTVVVVAGAAVVVVVGAAVVVVVVVGVVASSLAMVAVPTRLDSSTGEPPLIATVRVRVSSFSTVVSL